MKVYKTKEEAVGNKKDGDRLFHDPYINEYFIISPRKYTLKEGESEENFIIMPETFEECMKLRPGDCRNCEDSPNLLRGWKSCQRRRMLSNRASMEIL